MVTVIFTVLPLEVIFKVPLSNGELKFHLPPQIHCRDSVVKLYGRADRYGVRAQSAERKVVRAGLVGRRRERRRALRRLDNGFFHRQRSGCARRHFDAFIVRHGFYRRQTSRAFLRQRAAAYREIGKIIENQI